VIVKKIFIAASFLFIFDSCDKAVTGNVFPPEPRTTYLLAITWGLITSSSIDSLSSGVLHNYRGQPGDSLNIGYSLYPGLKLSDINLSFDSVTYISAIDTITPCSGVLHSDTSQIAYDTLVTATPLKPGYSDTLYIEKLSPSSFVYRVRYSDSLGTGVEINSFKFDRNH
jgi:hypothetical protein